jgi:hypothetical protein
MGRLAGRGQGGRKGERLEDGGRLQEVRRPTGRVQAAGRGQAGRKGASWQEGGKLAGRGQAGRKGAS